MFDTLRASQRLRDEGGFNERQAQAIAGAFAEDMALRLATKEDLDHLEERLDERLEHLDERLEHLEERLKHYVNVRVGAMIAAATALILAAMAEAVAQTPERGGIAVG